MRYLQSCGNPDAVNRDAHGCDNDGYAVFEQSNASSIRVNYGNSIDDNLEKELYLYWPTGH